MKRMTLVLCVLMLAAFVGTANADVGNNPNSFELDMNCSGETVPVHITVPVKMAGAGQVSDGRIGISHSHYIDFDRDGTFEDDELVFANGKGHQTTFCTWTWDNDPYVHGMDIQFVAPK